VAVLAAVAIALPGVGLKAQNVPVEPLRDGTARLSFGVRGSTCWLDNARVIDRHCPCGPGVAYATLTLAGGRVARFRMTVRRADAAAPPDSVGARWARLAAAEAAGRLLGLAARGGADGEELVAAASLADSAVVWPELLVLARDRHLAPDTRRAAIFWLSQAASEAATRGLDSIVADGGTDRELREHAVFALSQRPSEEAVPALIRIARTNQDGAIRRKAVFWLGQTDDSRAVALFEEILRR
jgi:hypothetical protein